MATRPVPKPDDLRGVRDVTDLALRAGKALRELAQYLESQPRRHLVQLDVRSLPVTVQVPGLVRPPAGVVLLGASRSDNPAAAVNAYGLHWVWTAGGVQITTIAGLSAGTNYRVSLEVVEA